MGGRFPIAPRRHNDNSNPTINPKPSVNRQQRHNSRKSQDNRDIEKLFRSHGVPEADREAFINWLIARRWAEFKEERMNQRILMENEINDLGIRLPNGTVNKEYKASFRLPLDRVAIVGFDGAGDLGLSFSFAPDGICTLEGIPAKPGDFTLTLRYRTVDGEPVSELKIPVAFNPDPRSLWVPKPVPANIEFPKADEDMAYVCVSEYEGLPQKDIVAASMRGRSHAQDGRPRDDDFRVSFNPQNGWYVLAVADGAGSARYSREGSRIACEVAERYCKDVLADRGDALEYAVMTYAADRSKESLQPVVGKVHDILFKGAAEAYKAIVRRKDESHGAVLKDFSTTLLLAICRRFSFGWFVASFGVGDGAIAIYDRNDDTVRLLNEPDGGEFAGQTRFLTMESIFRDRPRMRLSIVPDFTALMLMTDGISDPFFETDANLARKEKWDALWESLTKEVDFSDDNPEAARQLLDWLGFWSPGNHDDRTIAILY
ncbi:MAG: protein phosphatase 2C domain-containing protein [Muribaculaceae bacterium]|nr:protein phosphatase 2C domain-containing protein [Muribaculaceae bacterium]